MAYRERRLRPGQGSSLGLQPQDQALAHALLANKYLAASDQLRAVPITGKGYIHDLITDKYRAAQTAGVGGITAKPSLHPFAIQVIQAIVPDESLEEKSEAEIIEYKLEHKQVFERFSYTLR
jgi:hypothetical protein